MKVPLSWLRQVVDLGERSVEELLDVMSLNGLEVEEVHTPGAGTRGVRTKRVTQRRDHPRADKLQLVRVTDGADETEVVCGAWNFDVGDVVAHAEVGATLPPPPGEDAPLHLEAREIRGATSDGMLCSARELQLGDDHEGVIVLPGDTPVGVELTEVLPVGEPVVEIAVLADRGDHHSVVGIARELAAILEVEHHVPQVPELPDAASVPVTIDATDGCSQFVAWNVEGLTVGPSPWWLRQRLEQCGLRAINNVVDVTNYVMLELGHPLHAFDRDALHGPQIRVRWARAGEQLVTLDEQERTLEPTDLVVADADRGVALAGVMGGADTEVGEGTVNVLVEGAVWDPMTIRRTSRRLGLVSEASLRFERRVDPTGATRAVGRAVQLLAELGGGRVGGCTVAGTAAWDPAPIELDTAWCARFLGLPDLDTAAQTRLLRRLGCEVTPGAGAVVRVSPPPWRGDLHRPADLAEEVARLYGYVHIPATMPCVPTAGGLSADQRGERRLRDAALAAGFHEVRTRPFVGADALEAAVPSGGRVELENPLAKDAAAMSPTLVEGLLQVLRRNVGQGHPGTAVFELARIFRPAGDPVEGALAAFGEGWRWQDPDGRALPTQPRVLGLATQGLRHGRDWLDLDEPWSVHDVLTVFDEALSRVAPPDDPTWVLRRRPVERAGLHPGRTAVLELDGTEVGLVGQLHPGESERRDLPEPVVVGELLVEPLLAHLTGDQAPVQARPLTRWPAVIVDVALVAGEEVPYAVLERAVRDGAGELLDGLWWFDEYRGPQLGEGRRSLAFRLRLQSRQRQLTDEDAEAVIADIDDTATAAGAALRR